MSKENNSVAKPIVNPELSSFYGDPAAEQLERAIEDLGRKEGATARDAYRAFDIAAQAAVGDFVANGVVKGKTFDRIVMSKKEVYAVVAGTAVLAAAAGVGGTLLVQKVKARRAAAKTAQESQE